MTRPSPLEGLLITTRFGPWNLRDDQQALIRQAVGRYHTTEDPYLQPDRSMRLSFYGNELPFSSVTVMPPPIGSGVNVRGIRTNITISYPGVGELRYVAHEPGKEAFDRPKLHLLTPGGHLHRTDWSLKRAGSLIERISDAYERQRPVQLPVDRSMVV